MQQMFTLENTHSWSICIFWRLFWHTPKSAFTLFIKLNLIGPCLGISNEILRILVAQRATKLLEDEVGGLKILRPSAHFYWMKKLSMLCKQPHFFRPSTLTSCSFASPWATRMHSVSFESSEHGTTGISFKKNVTALQV